MKNKNTRGSVWHKWDLHIHTPASDGTGTPQEIVDSAISHGLSGIAITDHHTAEYIDKVKAAAIGKNLTVISGVEFRSEYGSKSVHFIAYFPDKYKGTVLDSKAIHDMVLCKLGLSKTEIITKGKIQNESLNDDEAFKKGTFLVQVDFKKSCDLVHSYGGLISVHNGSKENGLDSEVKHNGSGKTNVETLYDSLGVLKEELMTRYIDICDIGKEKDFKFYLEKFNRPSIITSDAHKFSDIGSRFTWIKSDLTFEGFKQILYEPEDRVCLNEEEPDLKKDYQIIDSITFDNSEMGKQEIKFNQNLNTVIGGRSSGKSILLGCIANAIDSKINPKSNNAAYNKHIKELNNGVSVRWRDKTSEQRKVIYYSQSEISDKVRNDEYGVSGINELIENIVKKDAEKLELLKKYENFLGVNKTDINTKINSFCQYKNQIEELNKQMESIGNKKGIENEIVKIQNEIETVKKNINGYLTQEEDETYKTYKKQLLDFKQAQNNFLSDKNQYQLLKTFSLFSSIETVLSKFSETSYKTIQNFYNLLRKKTLAEWSQFIDAEISKINNSTNAILSDMDKIKESDIYKKGEYFQSSNTILESKNRKLQEEQEKKNRIEELEKEQKKLVQAKDNCAEKIWNAFANFKKETDKICEQLMTEKDEIKIYASPVFIFKNFYDKALSVLNKRNVEIKKFDNYEEMEISFLENSIKDIYEGIISEKYALVKTNYQQALIDLFSNNYYTISYDVNYDGDKFSEMSEGKKAFIALRLLLDFDDSHCPIIIDQPEDDLDNRAIYDKLVMYLRKQKKNRQIILATHNPNIVVGADAELVIVANQNGVGSPNQDGIKFEYYANSIENSYEDTSCKTTLLSKGIREHICEILEGGNKAFQIREKKYGYKS